MPVPDPASDLQHCDGEVTVRKEVQLWRLAAGTQ